MCNQSEFYKTFQLLVSDLRERKTDRYFVFTPNQANKVMRILEMFYTDSGKLSVSFFYDPTKNNSIAIRPIKYDVLSSDPLFKYLPAHKSKLIKTLSRYKGLTPLDKADKTFINLHF